MDKVTLVYVALGLMFVLPGTLAIWAGLSGSQWFFHSHSYRSLVDRIGLRWTRALFVLLGLLFFAAAALVIIDPMNLLK